MHLGPDAVTHVLANDAVAMWARDILDRGTLGLMIHVGTFDDWADARPPPVAESPTV